MNIINILSEIEKVDPEIYDRLDSRRRVFKHFAGFGKKVAAAAIPIAFGSMLNKAYGQSTGAALVQDTLKFAFLLENLEAEFYKQAVTAVNGTAITGAPSGGISAAAKAALTNIRDHEIQHVNFLATAITGTKPVYTAASFDFTANGNIPGGPFTNYGTLLAVAQALEDTGVRAYKGQAGNLVSDSAILQAALQIHSVEARHAAHIRRMRRDGFAAAQKPWITGKDLGGLPAFTQAVYNGEETATQAGVNITGISSGGITISANAATEAFDEPLTTQETTNIAKLFVPALR